MIDDRYFDHLRRSADEHLARTGRPLVVLSYAQGLDGSLARVRGEPLALSGPEAAAFTHRLRGCLDALLVGIGTVLADDPRLTARGGSGADPQPVILDTHFRLPEEARVWEHPRGPWIFSGVGVPLDKASEVVLRGGRLTAVPRSPAGRLSLPAMLDQLASAGIASVMVEGGAAVITSFLAERLADRAALTIAPVFVGGLRVPEAIAGDLPELIDVETQLLGKDILLTGTFAGN